MPTCPSVTQFGFVLAASLSLVACAPVPPKPDPVAPSPSGIPAISPEARNLLAQAEQDVQAAREQFALWTTAEAALKLAWEAANAGDGATVTKQARRASELVKAGLAQLAYPGTELK